MTNDPAATPVYLDCDTGVDDALALAYLLTRPGYDVVGIGTVSGNIDAETAARNTLDLLALAGRADVPVAIGAHDFLRRPYDGGAPHVHGPNGIGGVRLERGGDPVAGDAAALLDRLSREHGGRLEIIAIGPLTNLAIALDRDPALAARVAKVTLMGGAALAPGNISPAAEANISNDPEAAAAVFDAAWPVTMVGLDVTMHQRFDESDRERLLASQQPLANALGHIVDFYFDFYVEHLGTRTTPLHDPLAVAVATGAVLPTLAPIVHIAVDTGDGPARGATICDLRGSYRGYPPVAGARHTAVLRIDEPFAPLLLDALLGD